MEYALKFPHCALLQAARNDKLHNLNWKKHSHVFHSPKCVINGTTVKIEQFSKVIGQHLGGFARINFQVMFDSVGYF